MTLFDREPTQAAIQLYDYQEEDRAKVATAFLEQKKTSQLGVWPTGSGKTVMFSELHLEPRMQAWMSQYPLGKRLIIVVAHREELITQAVDKLSRSNPDLRIGVEKAGYRADALADVVVASVQTLTASKGKRLKKFDPDRLRILVIDEAHHAASPSYHAILHHFGFLPPAGFMADIRPARKDGRQALLNWQRDRLAAWNESYRPKDRLHLGVTATPKRGDNIGLECVYEEIVFSRTIREMIEKGRLSRIRAYRVHTTTSLDDVGVRAGDFEQDRLAQTVNHDDRNAKAVRAYLDYGPGLKGFVFCVDVAHAQAMAEAFRAGGIKAEAIHGNLSGEERKRILADFRTDKLDVMTNCQILTEGVDIPEVGIIIHARPTKSSLLYIQMTGRGLRVWPGKEFCIIIDIVDITKRHSLFTSPELFGLPVGYDAKGGDLLEQKVAIEELGKANPLVDLTDMKSIEDCQIQVSEVDLLGDFHDDTLDKHASLTWQRTGEGYEISWSGLLNEFLVVRPEGDSWITEYKKGQRPVWQRNFATPQEALQHGETWLDRNQGSIHSQHRKDYANKDRPASENQINWLKAKGVKTNYGNLTNQQARLLLQKHYGSKRK